jgi:hypothetical protein
MEGKKQIFTLLQVLPFSRQKIKLNFHNNFPSDRKRMSVILMDPTGKKGLKYFFLN